MNENIKRPNAALINREWFNSAKSVLSADALGRVLVAACNYVLLSELEPKLSGSESVVFAMIRPALDSDVSKYLERCARNASNAKSRSERVAASGSDSQRVGANTTTTPTSTPTSTSTSTPSLSPAEVEDREKWLVFGYFWSTGSNAVAEESKAFWSYYESLGWKNNKGAVIENKLAAARMWRRQFETKAAPDGSEVWFKVMRECRVCDYNLWTGFAGAERKEDHVLVRLRVTEPWLTSLKEVCKDLLVTLAKAWRTPQILLERVG